jgi:hypothetical protein
MTERADRLLAAVEWLRETVKLDLVVKVEALTVELAEFISEGSVKQEEIDAFLAAQKLYLEIMTYLHENDIPVPCMAGAMADERITS